MFGSGILDVAIGLIFVYLQLSLICSIVAEGISRALAIRANNLASGIRNLLNDPNLVNLAGAQAQQLAQKLYEHPLVKGLAKEDGKDKKLNKLSGSKWFRWIPGLGGERWGKQAYIPSRTFALALLDIVNPHILTPNPEGEPVKPGKRTQEHLEKVNNSSCFTDGQNESVKNVLCVLVRDAKGDLERLQKNVESWYDDTMDRVSSWYKRKAQLIILFVAALAVVILNADTLAIAKSLWNDSALRESIVSAAQATSAQSSVDGTIGEVTDQLNALGLPLGWDMPDSLGDFGQRLKAVPSNYALWVQRLVGWSITVLLVSLGAPFWFDVLSRFIRIRSSLKPSDQESETPRGNS